MRVLVHQTGFQHEEETVGILGKYLERGAHGVREIGLIRELGHRALLQLLAVERTVEVTGMEQAEQTIGSVLHHLRQLGTRGGKGVAGLAEVLYVVLLVLTLGAWNRAGQKIRGTAAYEHFRTDIGEHAHDGCLLRTQTRMRYHCGGGGVFDFRVGHDADGLVRLAAQKFSNGFLAGIVKGILGAVGVHSDGVHAGFVAGHVGGSSVRRVGGNGIHAAGPEHTGIGERVHRKIAVVHAVGHTLGKKTGAGTMPHAQTVGNKQDDVLGAGLGRSAVYIPVRRRLFLAVLYRNGIFSWFKRNIAQNDGRTFAFLIFDEFRTRPEYVGNAFSVDPHVNVSLTEFPIELHLEVKLRSTASAGAARSAMPKQSGIITVAFMTSSIMVFSCRHYDRLLCRVCEDAINSL